jgi:hypothetical protein
MADVVRDTAAMIAGMAPVLDAETYVFCTFVGPAPDLGGAKPLASFHEEEGLSLILTHAAARALGQDGMAMCRITLTVHSALDGIGLTAAVAGALADAGIACNMVAAFHHDHVFVPAADADRALAVLQELAAGR